MRAFLPLLLFLAAATAGCKARDGDILLKVCERLGEKLEATTGAAPTSLVSKVRGSVGSASLAVRVQSRIRWDRYFKDSDIEVSLSGVGVVTLSGQVADRALKQRAFELARTTVGVDKVVDELTLPGEDE